MEQQSNASKETRTIVDFLKSSKSGIKPHVGVLNGKRVEYFKGSKATAALLSPAYGKLKGVPPVADEEEANKLLHSIIPYAFFLRAEKGQKTKEGGRVLQINPMQMFQPDLHYVWLYEGSQLGLKLAGVGMVVLMLAGVMFPLWPPFMRLGVYYLSLCVMGLVGLFIAIAIVRLIFWLITVVVAKPGIWIFPNLFEDVGFVDSFIPLWAWDIPPPPKKKKGAKAAEAAGAAGGAVASGVDAGAGAGATSGKRAAVANLPGVGGPAEPQMNAAPQEVKAAPAKAAKSQKHSHGHDHDHDHHGHDHHGHDHSHAGNGAPAKASEPSYEKLTELD